MAVTTYRICISSYEYDATQHEDNVEESIEKMTEYVKTNTVNGILAVSNAQFALDRKIDHILISGGDIPNEFWNIYKSIGSPELEIYTPNQFIPDFAVVRHGPNPTNVNYIVASAGINRWIPKRFKRLLIDIPVEILPNVLDFQGGMAEFETCRCDGTIMQRVAWVKNVLDISTNIGALSISCNILRCFAEELWDHPSIKNVKELHIQAEPSYFNEDNDNDEDGLVSNIDLSPIWKSMNVLSITSNPRGRHEYVQIRITAIPIVPIGKVTADGCIGFTVDTSFRDCVLDVLPISALKSARNVV